MRIGEPHCPRCFAEIPLRPLWRVARTNRFGFLAGKNGVICPRCNAKLRVQQLWVVLGWIVSLAATVAAASYVMAASEAAEIPVSEEAASLILVASIVLIEFVRWRYLPTLAKLRVLHDGESVEFPLTVAEERDRTERAELAKLAAALEEEEAELERSQGPDWICSACRENNPGTFGICWKCETEKP